MIAELLVAQILALHLVRLTGTDGQIIEINPEEVVSVRAPGAIAEHLHPNTHCVIYTSDGKFISLRDDCADVQRKLEVEIEE
jgi:hypothetical protein